jgi:hypothetical protein
MRSECVIEPFELFALDWIDRSCARVMSRLVGFDVVL